MPFRIVRNDITHMSVDAIVNAANEELRQGGGVCGAIFSAAGSVELQAACDEIGYCATGRAVATPAFALSAKHIIHTVGPVWNGGAYDEERLLRSCYRSSLELAYELEDQSIAFPLISSGIFGYPKDQAIDVAMGEIRRFLQDHEMDVYLIVFDPASLRATRGRFFEIAQFIDDTYVEQSPYRRRESWESTTFGSMSAPTPAPARGAAPKASGKRTDSARERLSRRLSSILPTIKESRMPEAPASKMEGEAESLEDMLANLDASFSTTLLAMIDERNLKDSEVYKRANMSRQHFSKIRGNPSYQPKKHTVLALAVALELNLNETRLLLERAGFALTHADKRDIIVEHFIERGTYDIYTINLALYAFDQPLLG